jgi:imidazolonepropionase-like amidohydrolase
VKIMATGGVLSERDRPEHSQFADDELDALVTESHRAGVPVAAHAQGSEGVKRALRAGVDTIEHGFYLDDEAVDLLCNRGAVLVPTLSIMHRIVEHGEEYLPAFAVEKAAEAYEAHVESIRRAHEGGVRIAAGTDFIGPDLVPHGENPLELELLVSEIGLSPAEAVVAATATAGRALPVGNVGPLTEGNAADFLVLESGADPHSAIADVRRVAEVFKGGERVEAV